MALSRSGTASALNLPAPGPLIPTGNEPSQDVDKALQNAIHARYLGRYYESEALFKLVQADVGEQIRILNELAISYAFQGNFGKLFALFGVPCNLNLESKDASLSKLLLDYSQMHSDLMLAEAVETASRIWDKWLTNRKIEEYDDVDVTP